jgi:hypothetical protein
VPVSLYSIASMTSGTTLLHRRAAEPRGRRRRGVGGQTDRVVILFRSTAGLRNQVKEKGERGDRQTDRVVILFRSTAGLRYQVKEKRERDRQTDRVVIIGMPD